MRFADPKSDIAFKKIFGNEGRKEILISFLNAVLDLPEGRRVLDVEILNPYQAPRIQGLRETTLDVRAKDQRGVQYIVEMQVQKRTGFEKRVLFYSAKAYSGQVLRGEDYPRLNQVIFIGICDFSFFEGDDYLTRHLILNTSTLKQELTDLEFNFIELPKFNKAEGELAGVIEQWAFFLKNAPNLDLVPASVKDQGLKAAYETANTFQWTKDELDVYDYWSMRTQDERGAIQFAQEEGIKKGIQKGREEGIKEGIKKGLKEGREEGIKEGREVGEKQMALEIARRMKAKGRTTEEICELTGLAPEELAEL